jgi:hypothetical protein
VTALEATAQLDGAAAALATQFVTWLETGVRPESMFALREDSHPFRGEVRVEALDRTARGFALQFEERWVDGGQRWYCRELAHCVVEAGRIAELAIYCTGDWSEKVQQQHVDQVRLIRP